MPLWSVYSGGSEHIGARALTKGLTRALREAGQAVAVLNGDGDDRLAGWCRRFGIECFAYEALQAAMAGNSGRIVIADFGDRRGDAAIRLLTSSDRVILPLRLNAQISDLDGVRETHNLLDALRDNRILAKDIGRHIVLLDRKGMDRGVTLSRASASANDASVTKRPAGSSIPGLMDEAEVERVIVEWTEQARYFVHARIAKTRIPNRDLGSAPSDEFLYLDLDDAWREHRPLWQRLAAEIQQSTSLFPVPIKIRSRSERSARSLT